MEKTKFSSYNLANTVGTIVNNLERQIKELITVQKVLFKGTVAPGFRPTVFPSEVPTWFPDSHPKIFTSLASTSGRCLNLKFDSPLHHEAGSQKKCKLREF
jgi:hypothetical protein